MSQRRTLILIAAIAIGALASFLVWNYVGGIQDQAYSDAERVKVFLVEQQIPKGTAGNVAQASIKEESIPRKFKPANAIESRDDIAGQVAKGDLVPNQVVVSDMFVEAGDPEAQISFADNLTKIQNEDMVTFTLNVDEVRGVAGLIVPGDYVNIMQTDVTTTSVDDTGEVVEEEQAMARYLYQKVQVLAVDYLTVSAGTAAAAPPAEGAEAAPVAAPADVQAGLITFIVPAEAAQYLASIPSDGIYLSLVSKDYVPVEQGPIEMTAGTPAEDPEQLTPYGKDGARSSN